MNIVLTSLSKFVHAQETAPTQTPPLQNPESTIPFSWFFFGDQVEIAQALGAMINGLFLIAGAIALSFFLYGGFLYLTSAGEEEGARKGKTTLKNSLAGLLILALAFVTVHTVGEGIMGGGKEKTAQIEATLKEASIGTRLIIPPDSNLSTLVIEDNSKALAGLPQDEEIHIFVDVFDQKENPISKAEAVFKPDDFTSSSTQIIPLSLNQSPFPRTTIKARTRVKLMSVAVSPTQTTTTTVPDQKSSECEKIHGRGLIRIVFYPVLFSIFSNGDEPSIAWKEEDIQSGEWRQFVQKYFLSVWPFGPFDDMYFSLWRYDATSPNYSWLPPCDPDIAVAVLKTSKLEGFAIIPPNADEEVLTIRQVVLTKGILDFFKNPGIVFYHELGHAVGLLNDEYDIESELKKLAEMGKIKAEDKLKILRRVSIKPYSRPEDKQRNCIQQKTPKGHPVCPDWWKEKGAKCVMGCNYTRKGWARDSECDLMRGIACVKGEGWDIPEYGPIDEHYINREIDDLYYAKKGLIEKRTTSPPEK